MKILFCYGNWMNPNNGGVQRVSDTLSKYFTSKGHEMFYLTFHKDEKDNYQFAARIFNLPDSVFFSETNLNYYHQLLHDHSIDIIVNHDSSNINSHFFLNTGNQPVKKISLYHTDPLNGLNRVSDFSGKFRMFLYRYFPGLIRFIKILKKRKEILFLLKNSDKLILLSDEFKKGITKNLKITSSKIESISNPCVSSGKYDRGSKKNQLLFVSRIELSVKRPDKMLQIWSQLENKFPDWRLLFLGDGADRSKVEEISRSLGLRNVSFEGFVDPVPYYKDSSVICMTSDYEGFGLVLIEAMQFGLVPISFNNWSSLKDIIVDQETGIMVSSNNIPEYVSKLDHLLSNELLRERISLKAMEYVNKFQIESIGPKWISLFEDLLEGKTEKQKPGTGYKQ